MGCYGTKASQPVRTDGKTQLVDVVFICDCTQSMSSFIVAAKDFLKKLGKKCSVDYPGCSLQIAFVGYRDHTDGNDLLSTLPLTGDLEKAYKFIDECKAKGGGDIPEAVADALRFAADTQYRQGSLRLIFHILDAPPHGKEFFDGYDKYPEGCPCQNNCQNLLEKLYSLETQYILYTYGNNLTLMNPIFMKHHKDLTITSLDNLQLSKEEEDKLMKSKGPSSGNVNERDRAADVMISRATDEVNTRFAKRFDEKR